MLLSQGLEAFRDIIGGRLKEFLVVVEERAI